MTAANLAHLRNLGPLSARWLADAGIRTEAQLRVLGAVDAFRLVAMAGHRPSLNLLYALEGALTGVRWNDLPQEVRARLRAELEQPWDVRDLPAIDGIEA